jgi:CO/xanthine dehydrogenase Mo-binding subunit
MAGYLKDKKGPGGKNRGRGIACGFWHGATGSFGAYVRVNSDGSVNLVLGVTDISGSRTSIAQIVAEELCLPFDRVKVIIGDTETAPDKGVLQNTDLLDYRMPTAADVPGIDILIVEKGSSKGVYGLKHVGEPPMIPVPAALANAICNATGKRFLELPMTPEVILNAVKNRKDK